MASQSLLWWKSSGIGQMTKINKYKTKNQIFADFIEITNNALNTFSINGWIVKRFYQNIKTVDLKPCVLIQIINKRQLGSQYRNLHKEVKNNNTAYYREYKAKQEVQIRFSATMRNSNYETIDTYDSIDVLEMIKNYLQSYDCIDALSALGYAQYRAEDIKQQNFNNDDENVQFLPFFDCTFLYTDKWEAEINHISKIVNKDRYRI